MAGNLPERFLCPARITQGKTGPFGLWRGQPPVGKTLEISPDLPLVQYGVLFFKFLLFLTISSIFTAHFVTLYLYYVDRKMFRNWSAI